MAFGTLGQGNDAQAMRITDEDLKKLGTRQEFQIQTLKITEPGQRYDFQFLAKVTNSRVVGFFMTSSEVVENELMSNLNHSTIQLNIDNVDVIPADTDASLFSAKNALSLYDSMYTSFNEKADGSQVKGCYTSGSALATWKGPYELKIYLWEIAKEKR